jgi:signal transduction histidine kinase
MLEFKNSEELIVATKELAIQIAEKERLSLVLGIAVEEKTKLAEELVIAETEKAKRADELEIAKEEKANRAAELVIAKTEKAKRAAELVHANAEKAKRAAELVIANLEKEKRASELKLADKELNFQNKEKVKRAAEFVIAHVNKTKRNDELVIANIEKAKRAAELVIANKELSFQIVEKAKRAAEFVIADAEKAKRAAELVIANIRKAKRAAEFVIANVEKAKRSAELVIAKKELAFQKSEKAKRAAELIIANVEKATLAAELLLANIEKAKRAAELIATTNELVLAKEKEILVEELTKANRELAFYIQEIEKHENELIILNNILDLQNKEKIEQTVELIKAKENAEKSDRLKSAFLSNMSHEIRTPMNGILGFAELLTEPKLTGVERLEFIRIIQQSGARMLNTINNIVDISRIESGLVEITLKQSDINEQMEFIHKFFRPEIESKGLKLISTVGLQSEETIIITDIEKIYSILTNLVKNAIKFTHEGIIEIGYVKKGNYLEFYVRDTGVGISDKNKEFIFERFRQGNESSSREYEGSGLGLAISKSYVEMLGGKMWVESVEGKGSVFYFNIPDNDMKETDVKAKKDPSKVKEEINIKKLKILIAEDDEISFSLLNRNLREIAGEILHVMTGSDAIELCRKNPDIDLILMDIRMPDMNGYEATKQIRKFNKDVFIIAQTAYGFSDDSEKAIKTGCNDYISKPINRSLLLEIIIRHFNK